MRGGKVKKYSFLLILFSLNINMVAADDLADILQDLAVQTACLGQYSATQINPNVFSRYDDPPDWYTPPMMAERFARMSGDATRTNTFYGLCFDYAQEAYDDIRRYQEDYNKAGMKGKQWYIAATNIGDPNTIILYDPTTKEKATTFSNGVYLKQHSRHKVYAHDGAVGHAWLWIQHNNGTWYWIDPTWTDNTGYPWWGIVKDGKEVKYYPDPAYCVTSNYPRPNVTQTDRGTSSSNTTYPNNPTPAGGNYSGGNNSNSHFLIGYNYAGGLPFGLTVGGEYFYASANFGAGGTAGIDGSSFTLFNQEGQYPVAEWTVGVAYHLFDFLLLPIGLGANHSGQGGNKKHKFVMEIGLQPVLFDLLFFSATYRLIGFKKSSFTLGAGVVFK